MRISPMSARAAEVAGHDADATADDHRGDERRGETDDQRSRSPWIGFAEHVDAAVVAAQQVMMEIGAATADGPVPQLCAVGLYAGRSRRDDREYYAGNRIRPRPMAALAEVLAEQPEEEAPAALRPCADVVLELAPLRLVPA